MYQALLTRRYLTSKIMPLLAAVAVMLCVAMELIVWSVMGGFLVMLLESGRSLIGDVAINGPSSGFAYYDDLVKRLEADPMVEAASPTIETGGQVLLPYYSNPVNVIVKGIDGPSFDRVTQYRESLWWKPLEKPLPKDKDKKDVRVQSQTRRAFEQFARAGATLTADPETGGAAGGPPGGTAGMVTGVEVGPYNERAAAGYLAPAMGADGMPVLLGGSATLSVWPTSARGGLTATPTARAFPVVNQFRSGIYEIDANTILVRLDAIQRMLKMDRAEVTPEPRIGVDPKTGRDVLIPGEGKTVEEPARVTSVLVRARAGVDADALRARCDTIYRGFAADHAADRRPPPATARVVTWRDAHRTLIDAVENETSLVMFIFGIISLTSVFLVLAIFWAMVSEKTRDIGVLRAIGAGRSGVAWIWLRYGLAIGVAGAILGGAAAFLIVTNINPIHEWLGQHLGIVIWNPKVYYFTMIPHKINPLHAVIVMTSGVVASVAGALIPSIKAASMDPVRALRWE